MNIRGLTSTVSPEAHLLLIGFHGSVYIKAGKCVLLVLREDEPG